MAFLSAAWMGQLGKALAGRRAELLGEIQEKLAETKAERTGADASAAIIGGDQAPLDLTSELDLAMVRRDVEELRQIEAAQERLAQGTYGNCEACGKPVAPERLRVYPAASRCTACQHELERRGAGVHFARL